MTTSKKDYSISVRVSPLVGSMIEREIEAIMAADKKANPRGIKSQIVEAALLEFLLPNYPDPEQLLREYASKDPALRKLAGIAFAAIARAKGNKSGK